MFVAHGGAESMAVGGGGARSRSTNLRERAHDSDVAEQGKPAEGPGPASTRGGYQVHPPLVSGIDRQMGITEHPLGMHAIARFLKHAPPRTKTSGMSGVDAACASAGGAVMPEGIKGRAAAAGFAAIPERRNWEPDSPSKQDLHDGTFEPQVIGSGRRQ